MLTRILQVVYMNFEPSSVSPSAHCPLFDQGPLRGSPLTTSVMSSYMQYFYPTMYLKQHLGHQYC